MTKYACDVCETVEGNINRMSFNTGKRKQSMDFKTINDAEDFEYIVEDLDVCYVHVRLLAQYLLNRLTRKEEWEEQIAAYKYLHTIAKNNKEHKDKYEGV